MASVPACVSVGRTPTRTSSTYPQSVNRFEVKRVKQFGHYRYRVLDREVDRYLDENYTFTPAQHRQFVMLLNYAHSLGVDIDFTSKAQARFQVLYQCPY